MIQKFVSYNLSSISDWLSFLCNQYLFSVVKSLIYFINYNTFNDILFLCRCALIISISDLQREASLSSSFF